MKHLFPLIILLVFFGCGRAEKGNSGQASGYEAIRFAEGFRISKTGEGITLIEVFSPWPGAEKGFRYALIPINLSMEKKVREEDYDAVVKVPVSRLVVTSTTHIPALEALGVLDRLVGFPDTRYVSSPQARKRIDSGHIRELGSNESLNTERALELRPELVVGFGISNQNRAYNTLEHSGIPVVYNGDWTETSPLGKAEWIRFFAPFFGLEKQGDSIFREIVRSYEEAKTLALRAPSRPSVLSGALYKDVWYLPGGNSWASRFLQDANALYLWQANTDTGSLSLSVESVLELGREADFWVAPSQYATYEEMEQANRHYREFSAFRNKRVYTYARTTGDTGGLLYYELGPNRPDLILRDLIHILHPGLLPEHRPFFFKPLE